MAKNSFKDLEDLYAKERSNASDETKKKINANINLFGLVSNLIELYIPKVGSIIGALDNGPSQSDKNNKKIPK